jgi:unsaturated rhamnogalacturonyl hydrolase
MDHRLITLAIAAMAPSLAAAQQAPLRLRVTSTLDAARPLETVEVTAGALAPHFPPDELSRVVVADVRTGGELLSQAVDQDGDGTFDRIVFQADFAPGETREFTIVRGEPRKPAFADYRVYGRFVRERHDDFAWENDRVAFRVYGPALETYEEEPLTSSAVDAWSKSTTRLVLNEWFLVDDYHHDHGEGGDFYPAGRSRGCGGGGLVVGGVLAVSRNFRASRVLAAGPIRLVFEVDYPEWQTPGLEVEETKRVTLDAGSHLNRFQSFYRTAAGGPVTWAAGIRLAEGVVPRVDPARGILRTWEHQTRYGDYGWLGCGVIVDPAVVVETREEDGNQLAIARTPPGAPATWYAGSGWDRSGRFADAAAWDRYLDAFAARVRSPLRVEVVQPSNHPSNQEAAR